MAFSIKMSGAGIGPITCNSYLNTGTTYTPDANGLIVADPKDVPELLRAGFTFSVGAIPNNPRNMIDGGDAGTNLWQIGTSFGGTSTAKLTADRFAAIGGTAQAWQLQRSADTSIQGFTAGFQFGRSATDTHTTGLTFGQVFETADSIRMQGQPMSMSAWAVAGPGLIAGASAGSVLMQLIAGTGVDDTFANLCAGSWTGASTVGSLLFAPSGARVSAEGTVPTNATQLGWLLSYQPSAGTTAGTTEWVRLLGIQVEKDQVTTFEHLDVAEVADVCQRYITAFAEPSIGVQVGMGAATAASLAAINIPLPITMRKAPTLTITIGGFAVTDGAGAAHTISGAGAAAFNTPNNIGLQITAATTLTAGQASMLIGRTSAGLIIAAADYANP